MATSGEQNQDLEEVGRGIGLLNEIEERTGEPDITGYTANPTPSYQSRGRPKFDIHKEQIEHLLNLNLLALSSPAKSHALGMIHTQ